MRRRRVRTSSGVIPQLARALWRGLVWVWRHPQLVIVVAALAGGGVAMWRVVTTSEAFRVTEIRVPEGSGLRVSESVIGQNLWQVDVARLAEELTAQRPQLKRVRVIRRPPHTLEVEVLERTPVAQLQLGQWYAVDEEGFILPDGRAKPFESLPALKGVQPAKGSLKAGRANAAPRLQEALRIVAMLRRSSALCGRAVSAIELTQARHVRFVLDDALEVRCGEVAALETHLARLRLVLDVVAQRPMEVAYIDMRFADPVIGAKPSGKRRS